MLDAGKFWIIIIIIIINVILYKYFLRTYLVKINIIRNQSAVVKDSLELSKATQRLNARNLYVLNNKIYSINDFEAYLVGLIEGKGCFSIIKKGKYLTYELSLEMNIRDTQLLYKIKKILGVGKINLRLDRNTIVYCIRDKKNLKGIILPIFDKYRMLTKKEKTYEWFRKNLLENVIYSDNLESKIESKKYKIDTEEEYKKTMERVSEILSVKYFESWLIGFIEAEGCFSVYNSSSIKENVIASFSISQIDSLEIIEAIRIFLKLKSNIHINSISNSVEIKTESKRGIENVVKYLGQNRVKLLGHKRLQFLLLLKTIRGTKRYSNIKIPVNY